MKPEPETGRAAANLRLSELGRYDDLCDAFEAELRAGKQPRIEEFIERGSEDHHDHLLAELLRIEVQFLHGQGQSIDVEAIEARFPDHLTSIRSAIASCQADEMAGSTGEQTITFDSTSPKPGSGFNVRCPHCHNPIEVQVNAPLTDIPCPSCGSSFNLVGGPEATGDLATIGQFQLTERLGMGAFGAVWKARDNTLDRVVAVKIPRRENVGDQGEMFFREARSAAQLRHPNIVPVHEVGRDGSRIYIVSDFIEGRSLHDVLEESPPGVMESVRLAKTLAEALSHAHGQGVVHRDLKPSNVMIDSDGQPHLMDFGLAKREAAEITMTVEGQILGTPAFMSPEQAKGEGHAADGRSDIYSLGVMLYRMLTGELPFRGSTRMLIYKVIHDEPPPLRRMDISIPRDLETLVLKCLEKDPAQRYQTAAELAEELGRFLNHEPIKARPIGKIERGWRWCRRNRAVASLMAVVALVLVTGTTVSSTLAFVAQHNADIAEQKSELADRKADEALREETRANQKAAEASAERDRAERNLDRAERLAYAGQLAQVNLELENNSYNAALLSLHATRWDMRGWEISHFASRIFGEAWGTNSEVRLGSVAIHPNGEFVAGGDAQGKIHIWQFASGTAPSDSNPMLSFEAHRGVVSSLSFSSDGMNLISGGDDGFIRVWDTANGEQVRSFPAHQGRVRDHCIRYVGLQLLTAGADGQIKLWNTGQNELVRSFHGHKGEVRAIALSEDERLLVSGGHDGMLYLWEIDTGTLLQRIPAHNGKIYTVDFGPGGQQFVSGGADKAVRVWQRESTEPVVELEGHLTMVMGVAFAGKDKLFSADWDGTSRLWDLSTGKTIRSFNYSGELLGFAVDRKRKWGAGFGFNHALNAWPLNDNSDGPIQAHEQSVEAMIFSPDSRLLATCAGDEVSLWDARTNRLIHRMTGHREYVWSLAFSDDAKTIYSSDTVGVTRSWSVETGEFKRELAGFAVDPSANVAIDVTEERVVVNDLTTGALLVEFQRHTAGLGVNPVIGPKQDMLAIGFTDGVVNIWSLRAKKLVRAIPAHEQLVNALQFVEEGRMLITSDGVSIRFWDCLTGDLVKEWSTLVADIAAYPEGNRLFVSEQKADKRLSVWDMQRNYRVVSMNTGTAATCIALSPDGTQIAIGTMDGMVRIARAEKRIARQAFHEHNRGLLSLSISGSGRFAATSGANGFAKLWNLQSGRMIASTPQLPVLIPRTAVQANGAQLVTLNAEGVVAVWNASTMEPETEWQVAVPRTEDIRAGYYPIAIDPQAENVAMGMPDGSVALYSPSDGSLIQTDQLHDAALTALAFSLDGSRLASGCAGKEVVVRDTANAQEIARSTHQDPINSLCFQGRRSLMVLAGKQLSYMSVETPQLIPKESVELSLGALNAISCYEGNLRRIEGDGRSIYVFDTGEPPAYSLRKGPGIYGPTGQHP